MVRGYGVLRDKTKNIAIGAHNLPVESKLDITKILCRKLWAP